MEGDLTMTLKDIVSLSSSTNTKIDGDKIWTFLGQAGRYQLLQTFMSYLGSLTFAPTVLAVLYTGSFVEFTCIYGNSSLGLNISTEKSSCEVNILGNASSQFKGEEQCHGHVFDGNEASYLAEWDLVCDKEALGPLPQTLTMAGMAVGASFLPSLADLFGRKKLLVASQVATFFVLGAMAFIRNFEIFLILKFLSGAFNQSNMIGIMTILMELYTTRQRSVVVFLHATMWILSAFLMVPVAYGLRDEGWRRIQLVYAFFSVFVFFYAWFYDESVRWLLANGKVQEAETILKKACRLNNKSYDQLIRSMRSDLIEAKNLRDETGPHEITPQSPNQTRLILQVFKNKYLRTITLISCFIWIVDSMTYYGIYLLSTSLPGNQYVNLLLINVMELIASTTLSLLTHRFGRKRPLIAFMLSAALCLLGSVLSVCFLSEDHAAYSILLTGFTQLGKFCITGSFGIMWIYTPELYPINIRNIGTGMSSTAARIASMVTPFFTILVRRAVWVPGAIFGTGCLVGVLLIIHIPETRWNELPQDIEDVETFFKDNKKGGKKSREAIPSSPTDNLEARV